MSQIPDSTRQVELAVEGMSCGNCVQHVHDGLKGTPGVLQVEVELERGRATVGYTAGAVAPEELVAAIEAAGYSARVQAGSDESSP